MFVGHHFILNIFVANTSCTDNEPVPELIFLLLFGVVVFVVHNEHNTIPVSISSVQLRYSLCRSVHTFGWELYCCCCCCKFAAAAF